MEQEAIETIRFYCGETLNKDDRESLIYAIDCIKELQQYRAIGTVEEIKRMQKYVALARKHDTIGKVIEACAEYEEIGTVEECREAVEKKEPVKITRVISSSGYRVCECGNCGNELSVGSFDGEYCHWCGQRLDWSENEVPESR